MTMYSFLTTPVIIHNTDLFTWDGSYTFDELTKRMHLEPLLKKPPFEKRMLGTKRHQVCQMLPKVLEWIQVCLEWGCLVWRNMIKNSEFLLQRPLFQNVNLLASDRWRYSFVLMCLTWFSSHVSNCFCGRFINLLLSWLFRRLLSAFWRSSSRIFAAS